jgi:Kef-type K+ transport system membrane component KefB
MLGVAVFEDIILWGVLAVATAIAAGTLAASQGTLAESIAIHITINTAYIFLCLLVVPPMLRRLGRASWNVLARESPVAWVITVLLGYVVVAAALEVTLVFAAFLAGFGIVGGMNATERERYQRALDSIEHLAAAVFIPIYFAVVGFRLDLRTSLDPLMLVGFFVGTSLLVLATKGLAARLGGFRGLDVVNISLTCNARGGPGIVLASVAFDAGIINAPFFTTLVLTAVLTSQACGFWLDFVIRRGWPLLAGSELRREEMEPAVSSPTPALDGRLRRAPATLQSQSPRLESGG